MGKAYSGRTICMRDAASEVIVDMPVTCSIARWEERTSANGAGVSSGEGDGRMTCATKQGALCGSGDISIGSTPGDDEGIGGVVAPV